MDEFKNYSNDFSELVRKINEPLNRISKEFKSMKFAMPEINASAIVFKEMNTMMASISQAYSFKGNSQIEAAVAALNSFRTPINNYSKIIRSITETSTANKKIYDDVIEKIKILNQQSALDFSKIANSLVSTRMLNNLEFDVEKIDKEELDERINEDDLELIQNTVIELADDISEKEYHKFNRKIEEMVSEGKQKNYVVWIVLYMLFQIFVIPYLTEWGAGITKNVVNIIRNAPSSKASKTDVLSKNTNIVILEDAPYYYKIAYEIEESGELVEKEGYLSKRSVVFENVDDIEEDKKE